MVSPASTNKKGCVGKRIQGHKIYVISVVKRAAGPGTQCCTRSVERGKAGGLDLAQCWTSLPTSPLDRLIPDTGHQDPGVPSGPGLLKPWVLGPVKSCSWAQAPRLLPNRGG